MADENKKALNIDDLENVAGGLIVDCGWSRNYRIVDEKTGEIIDTECFATKNAQEVARYNGVSTDIITMEEYKKRFGRDLDLSIRVEAPYPKF